MSAVHIELQDIDGAEACSCLSHNIELLSQVDRHLNKLSLVEAVLQLPSERISDDAMRELRMQVSEVHEYFSCFLNSGDK